MKQRQNQRRNLIIAGIIIVLAAMFGVAIKLIIKYSSGSPLGIGIFAILLIIAAILCALLCIGSMCIWVYKDCIMRDENPILWVLAVIFTSPVVGVILYVLVRKEERVECSSCQRRIGKSTAYCEYCGYPNEKKGYMNRQGQEAKKRNPVKKYLAASILSFAIMIGCFVSFIVMAFTSDSFVDSRYINTGIMMMSVENSWGNKWTLKFSTASDGYKKTKTFKVSEDSEILYADITCESGELLLHIIQGGKEEVVDVSNLDGPLEYSLEEFETGKITVMLKINGAKNVSSEITVK